MAYLVSGVKVSLPAALGGAIVQGVLNGVLGPMLRLLTLPLTVMTLGLFSLVITAVRPVCYDPVGNGRKGMRECSSRLRLQR